MKLQSLLGAGFLAVAAVAPNLQAVPFVVDAKGNSSSGGTAVNSISLNSGELFSVTVAPTDLWNAGALYRWSNANGLTGADLIATGSDDSGYPLGQKIGENYPLWTQNGFTAPYGALVGRIGSNYLLLGTSFLGAAPATGVLELMYWDSNNGDNTQYITADVNKVPDAGSTGLLLGMGVMSLGLLRSRFQRR